MLTSTVAACLTSPAHGVARRRLWLAAALAVAAASAPLAVAGSHAPALLLGDGAAVAQARMRLAHDLTLRADVAELQRQADDALATPVGSVMQKPQLPPSGDRHDYYSLSPYWWPNPHTADGLPYVWRDGVENPERDKFDFPRLVTMAHAVDLLATAYYYTGQERYAAGAAQRLRVWFLDPATRMNPNLRFAQVRRGQESLHRSSIIETIRFRWLPDASLLLAGSPSWTPADEQAFRAWFGEFARWFAEAPEVRHEARAPNNHGSWYAEQVIEYALFSGDPALARSQLAKIPARIAAQILPDGREPKELVRTKALHYSNFNNLALLTIARLGRFLGTDLVSPGSVSGQRLRASVDRLIPFVTGEQPWPNRQIQPLEYDQIAETYWLASVVLHDATCAAVIPRLPGHIQPPAYVPLLLPRRIWHRSLSTP